MLANLVWAGFWLLQGQGGGEVGWDLRSMWSTMGIPAKTVVFILFVHVGDFRWPS